MKGWGTDDSVLIKIIANRKNQYRQDLKVKYKSMFGKDLIKELKSETSGDFENAIVALFETPTDYDCISLRKAIKGAGTDEDTLIEIIASRKNSELKAIVKRYKELFNRELEEDIKGDTHGDFEKILVSLIQCNRSENTKPNMAEMQKKADELYAAGEGKWGTDESIFNKILATASPQELIQIAKCYHQKTGKTILQAIDSEFGGHMKKIYNTIVYAMISPSEYFARRIDEATRGLGTRDEALIRVCVTRDEIDMPQIKSFYQKLYNKTVMDTIKSECSGSYKKLLLELVDH
jgi:hypothetical protein